MSVKKKENEWPDITGNEFWVKKMRTLFRRLDTNGNGFLQVEEILDVATCLINDVPKMENYKGDNLVNTAVQLWYGYICPQNEDSGLGSDMLNESQFVEKIKITLNNAEFKSNFFDLIIKPFFEAADADGDGFLSMMEFRVLMKAWKAPDKCCDPILKAEDSNRSGKMTIDSYNHVVAEYFYSEDPKSNIKTLWGPLVNYKRPEDYGELVCGAFWEGKMRTMFRRMDVDGQGKLRCNDFIQIARGIIQRGHLDKKKGEAVMRALLNIWVKFVAVDKDGKHRTEITEKEFIRNLRQMINGKFRREIDQFGWTFFKAVEVDGNGFISMQEYRNLQEAWRVQREEADAMFKLIDRDKDNSINADEYLNAWCDYFLGEDPNSPYKSFFGPHIIRHNVDSYQED